MKRYLNLIYHMRIIGSGLKDVVITTDIQNTQHALFTVRPDNNIPLNFMVHKPRNLFLLAITYARSIAFDNITPNMAIMSRHIL